MNKSEREALALVLDDVGKGFTKYQAECKLLREFLRRTQPKAAAAASKAGACNNNRMRAK